METRIYASTHSRLYYESVSHRRSVSHIWIPAGVDPAPRSGARMTDWRIEKVLRSGVYHAFRNKIQKKGEKAREK